MGHRTSRNNIPLAWDDQWTRWRDSLTELQRLFVPCCFHPKDFGTVAKAELHVFSDTSQDAIGAAIYLRQFNEANKESTSLVYSQARVAPAHQTNIPQLELCTAVLAVQAA